MCFVTPSSDSVDSSVRPVIADARREGLLPEVDVSDSPLTVLLAAESAYGPTNNCLGIGAELVRMGHRVVFAAEESWAGKIEPHGIEERLVSMAPPPEVEAAAGQVWIDFITATAPEFRTPTIEQISSVLEPVWRTMLDGARYAEPQFRAIVDEVRPDVIVQDNVSAFPALRASEVPFVRLLSCQPLESGSPTLPPALSGLPADDPSGWQAWREEYRRVCQPVWDEYNTFSLESGAPALGDLEFMYEGDENIYLYPEAIDYVDRRPLGDRWHRVQSSVRATEQPIDLPPHIAEGDGSLIYLSLGSLGGADLDLMRRLTGFLADTPHRYIVSKGPRADEFDLPSNMWGAGMVPQTTLLDKVDLVITHGGNNTTCESFHFGKPMVVLPLFWDQYDNAQRVHEKGFGRRLDTYRAERDDLVGAIDELLADRALRDRMTQIGRAIRAENGVRREADIIAHLGLSARA